MNTDSAAAFSYGEAFSRNIGWVTEWEQLVLRGKRVAIAGMGGVGGVHLVTLARLGIGNFHIADFDNFEIANFNRQIGATMETVGRPKAEVLTEMAQAVNPEAEVACWNEPIDRSNVDAFLDGVDLYVDGIDFFALDVRSLIFARCHERGIPAITAGPIGLSVAYLVFTPDGMSFEEYFRLRGLEPEKQYVNFFMGLVPKAVHRAYLMDPTRMDLNGKRGPSMAAACQLCAGVAGAEAVKLLLDRGPIRAAPYYHQFDAYRGKYVVSKLRGGNRNFLQRLKLKIGYKLFASLSKNSYQPPIREDGPELMRILDAARWAPSGDNSQPWRFTVLDDDRVRITIQKSDNVYEYNDAQPTMLSAGFLLETLRIAASQFGRQLWWEQAGSGPEGITINVGFPRAPAVSPDDLAPYIPMRSVNRTRYRARYLTSAQRTALTQSLGDEFEIRWYETRAERWQMARLSGLATDVRLRIPEAFKVHQKILDWQRAYSPNGVPAQAIGLDAMTLKIMKRAMRDWKRMDRMNRAPGGTIVARLQMDYLPGHFSGAYFTVTRKATPAPGDETAAYLRAGQALQRFWLTASRLGLSMQPALAVLCFAHYGREGVDFTADPKIRRQARALAEKLDALPGGEVPPWFMGRIGVPRSRRIGPRSMRRPLEELLTENTAVSLPAFAGGANANEAEGDLHEAAEAPVAIHP